MSNSEKPHHGIMIRFKDALMLRAAYGLMKSIHYEVIVDPTGPLLLLCGEHNKEKVETILKTNHVVYIQLYDVKKGELTYG